MAVSNCPYGLSTVQCTCIAARICCVLYTALDPQDYKRAEMPTCLNSLELNSLLGTNRPLFSTLYKSEANIVEIAADYLLNILLKSCVQLDAWQQLLAGGNLRFTGQVLQANVTEKSGQPFQCLKCIWASESRAIRSS